MIIAGIFAHFVFVQPILCQIIK